MSETKKVTVLYVPVGEAPRMVEVDGSLKSYQELVGGLIQPICPLEDNDVVLVCNDEGKLIPLPPNRTLRDPRNPEKILDTVCGNFFLAYSPEDSEDFESLPDDLAKKYTELFREPEHITEPVKPTVLIMPFDPAAFDPKKLFGSADSDAVKGQPDGEKNAQDRLNDLFAELVPFRGKADTVAGEIVRAVSRIGYRCFNDGDHIGVGYGNETCNAAARYLMENTNKQVTDVICRMWGLYPDDAYESELNDLIAAAVEYLDENPDLKTAPNSTDMFDYQESNDLDYEEEDED